MNIRHLGISILIVVCVFGVFDIWGTDVWAAVIASYMITYGIAAAALIALSVLSQKRDTGAARNIDIAGVFVGAGSIAITILYFVWDVLRV
jgi:formate-dependent nitrite reductase membrane component NrfD